MSKQQVIVLSLCYIVVFSGLAAIVNVMSVYLDELGQDSAFIGFFLAAAYLALAISVVIAGRLSDVLQRRKLPLIIGGVLCAPLAYLMSQTDDVTTLMLLSVGLFFMMGIVMTMVSTLTGLFSDAGNRGRLFGLLNLSVGVGLMFGSFMSGRIVDRWDYATLFVFVAGFYLVIPLVGLFAQDKDTAATESGTRTPVLQLLLSHRSFLLLFSASILSQAGNTLIFLARPLIMADLNFDTTAITGAAAVGSLITLPLPLLIGWLADHFGRKLVIIVCFVGPIAGLLIMAGAVEEWHFWAASILQTIMGLSVVVGSAYITDTFPQDSLGTALSLLNTTPWIGIVLGLSLGGMAISGVGMVPTLLIGTVISGVALLMLLPMSLQKSKQKA